MATDETPWVDEVKDVEDLTLDLQNPRLPKKIKDKKDTAAVLEYLLEKEGVLDIARSIALNGYHHSAISIAYKEGKNLVILDGNRRLAACKILRNPALVAKETDRKKITELSKKLSPGQLSDIKVSIAPSRKAAEKEIWDIHVNRLLKSWEKLQRLRMYRNLIDDGEFTVTAAAKEYGTTKGDFANELAKLYFYEVILTAGGDYAEEKMREAGFNAIERLIVSKNGKRLLKYEVTDEGDVRLPVESEAKLKKLIPYVIGDSKLPAQVNQKYLEEYVYGAIDPAEFPKKTKNGKKVATTSLKKTNQTTETIPLPLKGRRSSVKYGSTEASRIVEHILIHFDYVANQILDRHEGRQTLEIHDEYDVQDLLHALLALFFDDVSDEEWSPSIGAAPSRMDFLLLDNGTVIETKTTTTRKGDPKSIRKSLEKELSDDLIKYSRHPKCKKIYLFVYDPEKKIHKPSTFERAFDSVRLVGIDVKVIVNKG